jgi:hypothetical protein
MADTITTNEQPEPLSWVLQIFRRRVWFEHEVVNDKLNVMGKEIEQPGLPSGPSKVVLGESDHWQTTARGVDPISAVG